MPTDFNHIISLCKQKDRAAQQRLYKTYIEPLYNAALRYSRDNADAKDLVHDTFVKVFKNISKFKGDSKSIFGWMLKILINESLQNYRKLKRIDFVEEFPREDTSDGEEDILNQMANDEIWDLIKLLKEEEQLIINLSIVDQLSHKEISEILGITPSHSRTRLTRAKQALKLLILKRHNVRI